MNEITPFCCRLLPPRAPIIAFSHVTAAVIICQKHRPFFKLHSVRSFDQTVSDERANTLPVYQLLVRRTSNTDIFLECWRRPILLRCHGQGVESLFGFTHSTLGGVNPISAAGSMLIRAAPFFVLALIYSKCQRRRWRGPQRDAGRVFDDD